MKKIYAVVDNATGATLTEISVWGEEEAAALIFKWAMRSTQGLALVRIG
jgi:hypothetical protein